MDRVTASVLSLVLLAAGCSSCGDPPAYREVKCDREADHAGSDRPCCGPDRCWTHQTDRHDCPHHHCSAHTQCHECGAAHSRHDYGCCGRYSKNLAGCVCRCHEQGSEHLACADCAWQCPTHACFDHHCGHRIPYCCARDRSSGMTPDLARQRFDEASLAADLPARRALLEEAVALDPTRAEYFAGLAEVCEQQGDAAAAAWSRAEASRRIRRDEIGY